MLEAARRPFSWEQEACLMISCDVSERMRGSLCRSSAILRYRLASRSIGYEGQVLGMSLFLSSLK